MNKSTQSIIKYCVFFLVLSIPYFSSAQTERESFTAQRIESSLKIDGVPDESVWSSTEKEYQFIQNQPDNGASASHPTQVKIHYNETGIYITASMKDDDPGAIPRELGLRDDADRNTDVFAVFIDTYDKGLNAFAFGVTAAGVQLDATINDDDFDFNWDAVWKSAVKFDEKGWTLEMEIPYFALRFPKEDVQTWGINFYRKIQNKNEESYWNFVDSNVRGIVNQFGVLNGIENIEPPLRLSLSPYMSVVHSIDDESGVSETSLNGGLDLKYGINESFTLDMSLIPDFSQVRLDDQILNLSAFEVRFSENRPFFTEGTELFDKRNLFYSRRVGQSRGSLQTLTDYDSVVSRPGSTPLLNATKISGRTKKGTGIGFFNAVTNKTTAEIATPVDLNGEYTEDADGNRRYKDYKVVETAYDELTNFNVLVVDQNLKNNSNVALINTNVTRDGGDNANVTAGEVVLLDKTNTYRFSGFTGFSNVYDLVSDTLVLLNDGVLGDTISQNVYDRTSGFKYTMFLGKVSGKWQYNVWRNVESENYDINDMGFMQSANEVGHGGRVSYNIFKPFWKLNGMSVSMGFNKRELYKPRKNTEWNFNGNFRLRFKNFWTLGGGHGRTPQESSQYFYRSSDPDEVAFVAPSSRWIDFWISTDSRKALFVSVSKGGWKRKDWNQKDHWHSISTRYRVNNKLSFTYDTRYMRSYNEIGYVWIDDDVREENGLVDMRVFGDRNLKNLNNVVGVNYVFNNKMGINLRVRHNWTRVRYASFSELEENGNVSPLQYTGLESGEPLHDQNFNSYNMNLSYSWQIAPGSFVTAVWNEGINTSTNDVNVGFTENLRSTLRAPQFNSVSIRLTYFLDYLTIKNSLL